MDFNLPADSDQDEDDDVIAGDRMVVDDEDDNAMDASMRMSRSTLLKKMDPILVT